MQDVAVYETRLPAALPNDVIASVDAGQVDWITFTSSSTARNFVDLLGADRRARLNDISIASIGPITTSTLNELGLKPTVQATSFDVNGLVAALVGAVL